MQEVLPVIRDRLARGEPLALATLVSRKGSAPRGQGARLLADRTGLLAGTVGGGAAEAAVLRVCAEVLRTGGTRLLALTLTNAAAAAEGMVCGGEVRAFVEFLSPDPETRTVFDAVAAAMRTGGIFFTLLAPAPGAPPERFVYAEDVFTATPPGARDAGALLAAVRTRGPLTEPAMLVHDGKEYFADPLSPPFRILITGAGHVAAATTELASFAGFSVHVIDDRPEFARRERFPKADSVTAATAFADCLAPFAPDAHTCIVIVTRGHLYDGAVLAQALRTDAGYIGMIGSRKKRESVYEMMRASGFSERDLARVHCPIGMAIGAETPEEIAVSILGECIAHKRKKRDA